MADFQELNEERREQIIVAALAVFAEKGYEQASTNVICKEAGVSKGLLFHYFENKKGLYLYILDRCITKYKQIIDRLLPKFSEDIVERIFQIMEMKIRIFAEDPMAYSIVINAFIDFPLDIREEIEARNNSMYEQYLPQLFAEVDYSVLKPGIDTQKTLELINLVTEGISDKYIRIYKETGDKKVLMDFKSISEELKIYMEMLKYGIYRDESRK